MVIRSRMRAAPWRYIDSILYGVPAGRPSGRKYFRSTASAASGSGKCSMARRTWPPGSPSCRRRTKSESMAVPETTPSCPRRDTARASCQPETPMPMPP